MKESNDFLFTSIIYYDRYVFYRLCKSDPHQLSMRLISQAQEFVVEVKVQLLTLLHNQRINHLAEIFLTSKLKLNKYIK